MIAARRRLAWGLAGMTASAALMTCFVITDARIFWGALDGVAFVVAAMEAHAGWRALVAAERALARAVRRESR